MDKNDSILSELHQYLRHVVLIPDGNGRWAKRHGLPTLKGHEKGVEAVERFIMTCRDLGIKIATVWAFSTENWGRDRIEVEGIMRLAARMLKNNRKRFHRDAIRLKHLGRKDRIQARFPRLARLIGELEEETRQYHTYTLNVALDYGGRDEIVRGVRRIMRAGIPPDDVSEDVVLQHLDTSGQGDPDLIIRTSGEKRLSGILPFQSVYSELYFCPLLLPDLSEDAIKQAFVDFAKRKRRFGKRPV